MLTLLLSITLGCRTRTEVPLGDSSADSMDTVESADSDCTPAEEVCDGVDNDCDGLVDDADEDRTGGSIWYLDHDADGYGDVEFATLACTQPGGFVADSTDCDDVLASRHPGATEVCDGVDNDCDGLIDGQDDSLSGAPTWYADSDGDGYGGAATGDHACVAPAGTVGDSDDCDDGDPTVHPDADEVCNDLDDDCDGRIDGQADSVIGAPTWYDDADGDGYGDAGAPLDACTQPHGTVANSADCDDSDASIGDCSAGWDDGTICSSRFGTDDGLVPAWSGGCDTTAGFTSYGGHCYYAVTTEGSDWDDARASCVAAGGSLAMPGDVSETTFLYTLAGGTSFAGGCDDDVEGTWTWVTGEPWAYEDWVSGEPNNDGGIEDCMELRTSTSWNDIPCDGYLRAYTCEFE